MTETGAKEIICWNLAWHVLESWQKKKSLKKKTGNIIDMIVGTIAKTCHLRPIL